MNKKFIKTVYDIVAPIPKDQWTKNQYQDTVTGACCFLGHVNKAYSGNASDSNVEFTLVHEVDRFLKLAHGITNLPFSPAKINDDDDVNGYNEEHPKDRVIHLLEDMLAFEEKPESNEKEVQS